MSRTARQLTLIATACALSLALGILTNVVRRTPLPWSYAPPQARMLLALATSETTSLQEPKNVDIKTVLQTWQESGALFVDAREPAFFEEGHIPRAINLPREQILQARTIRELADKSHPVIVYCSGADCEDSRIVAHGLLMLGHSKVSVYPGGWEEWSASNSPVEK